MFLATSPKYKGKQLATKLAAATIALTKQLHLGENVKHNLNKATIGNDLRPGAVVAVFTSSISQKLAVKLEFEEAGFISYKDVMRNGVSFYDLVQQKQEKCLIVYKKL